jgi:hypothetical protein
MAHDDQVMLVNRLSEKTKLGEVEWKQSADENAYQVVLKKNSIKLGRAKPTTNSGNNPLYIIELIDSEGEVVETFTDYDLDMEIHGRQDQEYYAVLRDIYEMARRRALGADKVLKEILRDLD